MKLFTLILAFGSLLFLEPAFASAPSVITVNCELESVTSGPRLAYAESATFTFTSKRHYESRDAQGRYAVLLSYLNEGALVAVAPTKQDDQQALYICRF